MRAKDQLAELDVRPSKRRGQNFLINPHVIEGILKFGDPQPGERLVEIGGGLGALTEKLAGIATYPLHVVEIEPKFVAQLRERFPQVHLHQGDARAFDFTSLGAPLTVFGNLPYVYSTEILFHLVSHVPAVRRAILLLQKEFVDRMASPPGSREYGALSVMVQLWAEVKKGPVISGGSFHPPTKVDSRLVELRFATEPRVPVLDLVWFRRVVKAAFSQRRRMLSNSLRSLGVVSEESIREALQRVSVDGTRRAETLSLDEFHRLASALAQRTPS